MTQPRRIVLGAAALALALSVAAPADAQAPPPPRVAILVSGPLPAYQRPVATFRDTLAQAIPGVTFEVHDVGSDRAAAEAMVDGLVDRDVALVFATGARAAYVAATAQAEIPVVFASVLDWQSYRRALGRPHVAGVALETPPDAQLAHMKLLVPGLRRVVVVTPSAGTAGVQYVKFWILSPQVPDFANNCPNGPYAGCIFTDMTEIAVYGSAS